MTRQSDGTIEAEARQLAAQKQAQHTRRISDMEARIVELERKLEGLEALMVDAGAIDTPILYRPTQPPPRPQPQRAPVLALGIRLDAVILRDEAVTVVLGGYDDQGRRAQQRLELPYVVWNYINQDTLQATQTPVSDYRSDHQAGRKAA